jgi:hypothetical protein
LLDSKEDDSTDKGASAKQNATEGAETELSNAEDD